MPERSQYYVTTPIYYVNDRPHVGHCYTTLLADVLARFMRLGGRDVFFLTGTDEHSERVAQRAKEEGATPMAWADENAAAFRTAFDELGYTHDDFIRTTEARHIDKVVEYIGALQESGDVYLGDYSGWWDHGQEEYVTETVAREHDYKSPVTGKELVQRTESNYFFKLSKYADQLQAHIESQPRFILPEARRNEVLGRLRAGLQDVPVSRKGDPNEGWGIKMPGDDGHRIYVWIDALFNYLSTIDTDDRRKYWPADVHLLAKDILWFHAVIWPCMLLALGKPLPRCVYAHSYWVREGRKMSKSLGNFIDMPTVAAYRARFGSDAFRWYLITRGPMGATDADFSYAGFVETYNADLVNGIGNGLSRVAKMIGKYFDGRCPKPGDPEPGDPDAADPDWTALAGQQAAEVVAAMERADWSGACAAALVLPRKVDWYIDQTAPFRLAKDPAQLPRVGTILYHCAEALRIAAVLLSPVLPDAMGRALEDLGQARPAADGAAAEPMAELVRWGRLQPGTAITKGNALFPRADATAPEPSSTQA